MNSIFVIIPVYQPDERLIRLLEEMREKEIGPICLVDDGSGIGFRSLFEEAKKKYDCQDCFSNISFPYEPQGGF